MFHSINIALDIHQLSSQGERNTQYFQERFVVGTIFAIINHLALHSSFTMIKYGNLLENFINQLLKLEQDYLKMHPFNRFRICLYDAKKVGLAKGIIVFSQNFAQRLTPFVIGIVAGNNPKGLLNILLYPPGNYLILLMKILISNEKLCKIATFSITFVASTWVQLMMAKICAIVIIQVIIVAVGLSQMIQLQLG